MAYLAQEDTEKGCLQSENYTAFSAQFREADFKWEQLNSIASLFSIQGTADLPS